MSRSQARKPSGETEDGESYFTTSDILSKGNPSLKLLPADTGVPLLLFPDDYSKTTEELSGKPTPFLATKDGNDNTWFKCRHVVQEADAKKGKEEVKCDKRWLLTQHVNVGGTFVSHCKNKHWDVKKQSFFAPEKGRMSNFFEPTESKKEQAKKQKTSHDTSTSAASNAGNTEGETSQIGKLKEAETESADLLDEQEFGGDNNATMDMDDVEETRRDDDVSPEVVSEVAAAAAASTDLQPPPAAITHYACKGINHKDVNGVDIKEGYEFLSSYPLNIHVPSVQEKYKDSNLCPTVTWDVNTAGNFISKECSGLVSRDENKRKEVESTTTRLGRQAACTKCITLQFNTRLQKIMATSIGNDYGGLPNDLCSSSYVMLRSKESREVRDELRLSSLNDKRKISSLTRRNNDCSRLMAILQQSDVPGIRRLLIVHIRNGGGVSSFIEKCIQAAEIKMVGHASYRRVLIQRGRTQRDGLLDRESYKAILITTLIWKLGGQRLANTFAFNNGGLSVRSIQRHNTEDGILPDFRIGITCCVDDQGKAMIRQNMDNIFCNDKILATLPKEPCLVSIIVDGVALDARLDLDVSQLPHQITGLCRHCSDTIFNTLEDVLAVEQKLADEDIHLAQEAEVFVIAFNSKEFTSVLPVCISPTCKKDNVTQESTNTVKEILSTIVDQWLTYPDQILSKYVMSTIVSDGASFFRKGAGEICSKDLSPEIRSVYVIDGVVQCKLLNLTASPQNVTPSCDNDHLLKRLRARGKCAKGIAIYAHIFTRVDVTVVLRVLGIVTSAEEADRLFHPDDLMDVLETVKCVYAIGRLANIEFDEYPAAWRAAHGNRQKHKELQLLGVIMKLTCTAVVGHEDDIQTEGNHLSVSEYLTVLSKLAHMLFFLFRCNKTDFIPSQNYRNWQEMIKNMYICVTIAKANGVVDFYWFLNTSKRIEQFFGIMRSFKGGDLNFDALDLRNRAADATLCNWIYSLYPEWDEPSRRLKSCIDRKNVRSWKGDTKVANVDEVKCWNDGRDAALNILRNSDLFSEDELDIDAIISAEPGVDMFRPYATTIGVLAGDRAVYDLDDDDDEENENET